MNNFTAILLPITCPVCQHTWEIDTPAIPWRALPVSGEVICASCHTTLRILFQEKDGQLHRSIRTIPPTTIGEMMLPKAVANDEAQVKKLVEKLFRLRFFGDHAIEDEGDYKAYQAYHRDASIIQDELAAIGITLVMDGGDMNRWHIHKDEKPWLTFYDPGSTWEQPAHLGHRMYVIWSDEDNAYVVSVPALPGCMTHGSTYEEALQQGKDAIESWLSWES